uniref:Glycosylphosphatidylinositol anchor attachment 1 protein n=1 Tax=Plectus sambesii TaxID=2011161 RepID=A0A914XH57_9BILA
MRSLTRSDGRPPKWLNGLRRKANALCALLYVAGLIYLACIVWPSFNDRTYFSENALLPGLVDDEFVHRERTNTFAKQLREVVQTRYGKEYGMPHDWLLEQLESIGLEAYAQNFTAFLPGISGAVEGTNIFAVMRAARAPSVESIVVAVPFRSNTLGSIGLALSLASFCREQIYWSKDLIFVFTEHETIGMQAWLSAYHRLPISSLKADPLAAHGGAIQAALALEATDGSTPFSNVDIRYNMINGQLPNLDLVNLLVKMTEKEALVPTLYMQEDPHGQDLYTEKGYWKLAKTSFKGIVAQAFSRADSGLHSVFGAYGVQAVTISPYGKGRTKSQGGWVDIGRLLEGGLRSVNNLLEKFHQSFFFYFLPSTHRYVSIGVFMPAIGLLMGPVLIKALCVWLDLNDEGESSADGDAKAKKETKSESALAVLPLIVIAHSCGALLYFLPYLLFNAQASISTNDQQLFQAIATIAITLPICPWIIQRNLADKDFGVPSMVVLRVVALLELALIVGVTAVLNFGIAVLVAIFVAPISTITIPFRSKIGWALNSMALVLLHPLVACCVALGVYTALTVPVPPTPSWLAQRAFEQTVDVTVGFIRDSLVYQSHLYAFFTLALFPIWMMFWTIVHHRSE